MNEAGLVKVELNEDDQGTISLTYKTPMPDPTYRTLASTNCNTQPQPISSILLRPTDFRCWLTALDLKIRHSSIVWWSPIVPVLTVFSIWPTLFLMNKISSWVPFQRVRLEKVRILNEVSWFSQPGLTQGGYFLFFSFPQGLRWNWLSPLSFWYNFNYLRGFEHRWRFWVTNFFDSKFRPIDINSFNWSLDKRNGWKEFDNNFRIYSIPTKSLRHQ